jgi:hypothetical protein
VHLMQGGWQAWISNKLNVSIAVANANSKIIQFNLLPQTDLRTTHSSPIAKGT